MVKIVLLLSDSSMAAIQKRKCGVDFFYPTDGCGDREEIDEAIPHT